MTVPASTYGLGAEFYRLMLLLESGFDEETGEYLNGDDVDEALAALGEDVREKIASCGFVLLRMKADAAAIKGESKRLADRAATLLRARERLKERVEQLMIATDTPSVKERGITVTLPKASKKPEITGPVPGRFMTQPVAPEPRPIMADIARALKAGEVVEGARLIDGKRSVRVS